MDISEDINIEKIHLDPSKKRISVFGNSLVDKDSISIRILTQLQRSFPNIDFLVEDPTETLKPPDDDWWIIDAAEGVKQVTLIEDISKLEPTKSASVHDYDLSFDLYLLKKIGKLPIVHLIAIPNTMNEKKALSQVMKILKANGF
jgi:Ni,Fe-hydrogenase maturation factor